MEHLRRRLTRSLHIEDTSEGDPVTTLELFFDLVYAFAFTQVIAVVSNGHQPGSLLDGFIVLSLLWWSWCSFSWLANQARADEGVVQGAVIVAMVAVFIACLALPDTFREVPGALDGAAVVVACYGVVRLTHASAYLVAARRDVALRRQIIVTVVASVLPTLALLTAGAAAGHPWQRPIWLGAVLYDFAAVFVTAHIGWAIRSAAHFAERYSLIVILALGESIIEIAAGLGRSPLSWRIVVGAVLSILIAVGLYLAYFRKVLEQMERSLEAAHGPSRAKLGRDVFTYLHLPIIAGIIVSAFGAKVAMSRLEAVRLGPSGGWALGCGVALFLAGTVATAARSNGSWLVPRVAAGVLLVAVSPLLVVVPSLAAVGIVAAVLLALAAVEAERGAVRRGGGTSSVAVTAAG